MRHGREALTILTVAAIGLGELSACGGNQPSPEAPTSTPLSQDKIAQTVEAQLRPTLEAELMTRAQTQAALQATTTQTEVIPTKTPTEAPTSTQVPATSTVEPTVEAQSQQEEIDLADSTMKQTKDMVRNPLSEHEIEIIVDKSVELGVTHVGIENPYDNPKGGNSVEYGRQWINIIRSRGLNVWHRHMPLRFEGIYDEPKIVTKKEYEKDDEGKLKLDENMNPIMKPDAYITQVGNFIRENPDLFVEGDIVTPIPEPQGPGVRGINCGEECMFDSVDDFNAWLVTLDKETKKALADIGQGGGRVKVVCCGFDGFIVWGDNNPDWIGKSFLYEDTVAQLGAIAIDHYPQGGATLEEDLQEYRDQWPGVDVYLSEVGAIPRDGAPEEVKADAQMLADGIRAHKDIIKGVMYWHAAGGREGLLEKKGAKYVNRPPFEVFKELYSELK